MKDSTFIIVMVIQFYIGAGVCYYLFGDPPCGETLPDKYLESFTIRNDTLFIKQGVDFTISTKTMTLDTAGTIYRNR